MSDARALDRTAHALVAEPLRSLSDYLDAGGMAGLGAARLVGPSAVIDEIDHAGVRGRGGAGFPTGRKWRSLRAAIGPDDAGFVVVNAAEGEPGTFKDRALLRRNPFLVLEGALIAAAVLDVGRIVVATKGRYEQEVGLLRQAIAELAEAGLSDGISVEVVEGPDHYLFGEETALLEVIEGEDPLPRNLAPYDYGLFTTSPQLGWSAGEDQSPTGSSVESANPALVNNVETYAHVALVLRHGAEWYRSMGTEQSPGPTIVTITGDVATPVVAEIALGARLGEVVEELAGGVLDGGSVKAVLSGVSNPVLLGDRLHTPITYEHLADAGGGLGSAGFIVFDDRRNMVDVAYQVLRFLHVESCGQCNPCKTGTASIATVLEDLVWGTASSSAIAELQRSVQTVTDASRCYLPRQAQLLVTSLLQRFPDDVEERLRAPGDPHLVLPKLVDLVDGTVVTDPSLAYKRPDWSYAETPVWLSPR
ncbi:MAG: hypothetical protein HKN26_08560 [Acidimicrobiales bacterium]|nr:hypothetical protein [Acidimicrobiales bacterium]